MYVWEYSVVNTDKLQRPDRASNLLELELQLSVNCLMRAANHTWDLCKSKKHSLTAESPVSPISIFVRTSNKQNQSTYLFILEFGCQLWLVPQQSSCLLWNHAHIYLDFSFIYLFCEACTDKHRGAFRND